MQFSENLIKLRKQNGYTQENLAEQLNVSRQAVARWEAGETAPDVYTLQKICEVFGTSADEILNATAICPKPAAVEYLPVPDSERIQEALRSEAAVHYTDKMTVPTEDIVKIGRKTRNYSFTAAVMAFVIGLAIAAVVFLKHESIPVSNPSINVTNPTFSSLSTYGGSVHDYWDSAEEYQEFMDEELKRLRAMIDSGESVTIRSEDGTTVSRPLTEADYEGIKAKMQKTLDSIVSGEIFAKTEYIEWKAEDGKTYSIASCNYGSEYWTAEEYKEWMGKELEKYRVMAESGESMTFYFEDGTSESHPISKKDVESIEESLKATYDSIKSGDLYTKDESVEWKAEDGQTYFVVTADAYVLDDSGSYTAETVISDNFEEAEGLWFETTETANSDFLVQRGKTFEEIFEPYKEYGLEYEEKDGKRRLYYNGTPVSKFLDMNPDGGVYVFTSDGDGEIIVQTVYNDDGKLVGVEKIRG